MTRCDACPTTNGVQYRVLHWFDRKIGVHLCRRCREVAAAMTIRMELLAAKHAKPWRFVQDRDGTEHRLQ